MLTLRQCWILWKTRPMSIHLAFWKESMINRLSKLINRNRSAAKMSQVLCSSIYAPPATYLCISLQMHVPACWKNLTFPRGGRYDIHNLNYNPYNHTEVTWPGDIWTITAKTLHLISWLRWLDFFFQLHNFLSNQKLLVISREWKTCLKSCFLNMMNYTIFSSPFGQ